MGKGVDESLRGSEIKEEKKEKMKEERPKREGAVTCEKEGGKDLF